MKTVKTFEKQAIEILSKDVLSINLVESLCSSCHAVDLRQSEHGYFLTLSFSDLPVDRIVLDNPIVHGKTGSLMTGFIAFIENREFTLECFTYGNETVPADYRDLDIEVVV